MSSSATDASTPAAPRSSSLLRSSAVMASGTLVSRILGFIRASMLIATLGSLAGGVMASFQTANTLPNMVFNILAAGVFDAVLVPQIVRAMKRSQGDVYVNRLITLAGTILFGVTLAAMVLSPLLILITAAGYDADIRALAIAFSLVCLPQIFFYGLYNLLGEVLNARGIFGPYMWAPVVNNIVGIAGLALFLVMWGVQPTILPIADFTGIQFWVLAGSSTLGVITQALVLIIPLRKAGISLKPDFHFRGTSFGSASKVAGWTFATLGVSQIGIVSTSNIVAQADAWAHRFQPNPSALADAAEVVVGNAAYATAFMIFMVPQSLISVSLATAVFTRLSHAAVQNDHKLVAENFAFGVRAITTLTLLASAILIAGAIPVMQMVNPLAQPHMVESYAWILIALMPGVTPMGMSLMSQRVFFAYEDARPVFFIGIIPNVVQVIVGWSMFMVTGPHWWVLAAVVAETASRVTQGVISTAWVARRNHYVNPRQILMSYTYSGLAAAGGMGAGLGAMALMGWHTQAESIVGRLGSSFIRLIVVTVVTTVVFWLIMRLLSPAETARVGNLIAQRLPLPDVVRRFIVGRQDEVSASTDNTDQSGNGDSGDLMNRNEHDEHQGQEPTSSPFAPPAVPRGAFSSPGFSTDQHAFDGALEESPRQEEASSSQPTAHPRRRMSTPPINHQWSSAASVSAGGAGASPSVQGTAAPDASSEATASTPAVSALSAGAASAAVHARQALSAAQGAFTRFSARMQEKGSQIPTSPAAGMPEPAGGLDDTATVPRMGYPAASAAFSATQGKAAAKEGPYDPTRPTVIFFVIFTIIAFVWAVHTATAPLEKPSFSGADDLASAEQSGTQSDAQSAAQSDVVPEPVLAAAGPEISSVTVLSWRDDQGDYENRAINMIDGDMETEWHSREFDRPFGDDTSLALVVRFKETTTLSELTLHMPASTSGGEISLKAANADNPRRGEVLATTDMRPTTTFSLPTPVETDSVTLTFRQVPRSVDGANWAWIYEITAK